MNKDPHFAGFRQPGSDFKSIRTDFQTTPLYYDIDLSVARSLSAGTALQLPFAANSIYIDQKVNTGFATFHFQDDARAGNTPVTVFAGFIARVPITQLIVENAAQAGMVMRVIYGVDIDFVPGAGAGVSVLNAINVNDVVDPSCEIIYPPLTNLVGVNIDQVVAPASNPSGMMLRELASAIRAGAGGTINLSVVAAATAPVAIFASKTNALQLFFDSEAAGATRTFTLAPLNRKIPAGWGIWVITSIGVSVALTLASYVSVEKL